MNQTKGKKIGYTTTLQHGGTMFAVFAETPYKLEEAFNAITGGTIYFDTAMVDRVLLMPQNLNKKKATV